MGYIYKLTCRTSGKSYIGQTKYTSKHRWGQHVWEANHPEVSQSRKLNCAILKYGSDDFIIEDICICADHELDQMEVLFVEQYGTFDNGYNLTKGGQNRQMISDETRERLSTTLKGKPKNVKNNRKRINDNGLPKYLKHYIDTKSEGYRICDHPNLKKFDDNASISFTRSDYTMQQKLAQAIETLNNLDNGTYVHERKQEPRGVQSIPNGYRVRIAGYPVKTFQSRKLTMDEKLKLATGYAEYVYKGAQFND